MVLRKIITILNTKMKIASIFRCSVYFFISDKQSAFMQFIQGNLDFLSGIDISYKDEILSNDGKLNPNIAHLLI